MSAKLPIDADRTVGLRIATLRKAAGLSQGTLATALGVTYQQIQKYEKGQNRVSGARLHQVARVFEVSIASLFEDATDQPDNEAFDLLSAKGAIELLNAFVSIESEQLRRDVLALAQTVVRLDAAQIAGTV